MNSVLNILKTYISTTSFLILTGIIYILTLDNALANQMLDSVLPVNGRALVFFDILGLIVIYEIFLNHKKVSLERDDSISTSINELRETLEKGRLISDINAAFNEFQSNDKEFITGEYYIKEIMTLHDLREKLNVNSYTQNKIEHLVAKIKHV
jgi:cell division protein YceG involved in septum cleavage